MAVLVQGTDYFIRRASTDGATTLAIYTVATVDDGDTLTVTLTDYGINNLLGVDGYIHTTTDSVVVAEAPETSVTTGTLTITVGGSTDNKKRAFRILGV